MHVVFVESLALRSRSPTRSLEVTSQRGRQIGHMTARAKAALTRCQSLDSATSDICEASL